jgi:hypothetical protein
MIIYRVDILSITDSSSTENEVLLSVPGCPIFSNFSRLKIIF